MKLAEMEKKNHAALKLRKNKRKRLVTGTVPVNKKYLTGTVDACAHGGGCWLGSPGPIELIASRRLAIPDPSSE